MAPVSSAPDASHVAELRHRYKALFEQTLYAIVLTRPDGTIIDANDTALTMFAVPRDEVTSFKVADAYVNLADRDALLSEVNASGSVQEFELRLRRANGATFLASYSGNLILSDGDVVGLIGVIRDITASRETEERLRQSEEHLNSILQHSPDVVARFDLQLRHVYLNSAVERYLGIPAASLIGTPIELLPENLANAFRDKLREVIATGEPRSLRIELDTLAGPTTFFSRLVAERDANGEITSVISFSRDVTELRAAQVALEQSEAKFRGILETAAEVLMLVDEAGIVRYVSPAVTRYGNVRPEHIVGQPTGFIVHPDDRARVEAAVHRVIASPNASDVIAPYRVSMPDGTILWCEASITNMLDHPAIRAVVAHARDVTGRVDAESARNRVEEQFRQAQKMEAIGRLAGGVAHDFNNLLTAITGSAELALDGQIDAETRADLQTIREAAFKAAGITRQLLAFSRKQMTSPRFVDVNEAVQGFEPLMRRLVSPEVGIEILAEGPATISIDPVQLEQALLNLVVNANDAMPQGGQLTVRTATRDDGATVLIEVRDTGVGIEEKIRARIFEPFFTTKPPGHGTGLGLATVYGIVDQAGGSIEIDSSPGKGSTFRLAFPAGTGVPAVAEETSRRTAHGGRETIMLVDDEASVRLPVVKSLKRLGYNVLEAKHGRDALTLLSELKDPVHLVITDLVMPEMGGAELIAELRATHPTLPVIFVSGYSRDVAKARGAAQEAPFLQKPFTMESLAQTVRETLDRDCPLLAESALN